MLRRMKRDVE
jgi:hypothetical protein